MLKLEPIEFFLRAIPEGLLIILGIYVLSKTSIDKRKYLVSSIVYAITIFCIRLLPINYGVHTILILLFLVLLTIIYIKIDVILTMRSALIVFLLQFISEGINVFILQLIPNINLDKLFLNPVSKTLLGIPSLMLLAIIIYIFYILDKRKDVLKDV